MFSSWKWKAKFKTHFGESEKKFNIWVFDYSYLLVALKSCNDLSFISVNLTEYEL